MISTGPHLLDEVERFGFTEHGLMIGSSLSFDYRVVDGVARLAINPPSASFDWEIAEVASDTHLLKKPGQPEVDMAPELLAAERAAGRLWQNYALLSSQYLKLHGHNLSGWVCIGADGQPWLIRPSEWLNAPIFFRFDQPFSLTLQATPYGQIGAEPVAPVEFELSLPVGGLGLPANWASIDPVAGSSSAGLLTTRIDSISSSGRQVLVSICPAGGSRAAFLTAPAAIWKITLTGSGPAFVATLEVERTFDQVRGTVVNESSGLAHPTNPLPVLVCTHAATGSEYTEGGLTYQNATLSFDSVTSWRDSAPYTRRQGVTGRLLAMVFDDADNVVEFACDALADVDCRLSLNEVTVSGTNVCKWLKISDGNYATRPTAILSRATLTHRFTLQDNRSVRFKLYRGGELVDEQWLETSATYPCVRGDSGPGDSLQQSYFPLPGTVFNGGSYGATVRIDRNEYAVSANVSVAGNVIASRSSSNSETPDTHITNSAILNGTNNGVDQIWSPGFSVSVRLGQFDVGTTFTYQERWRRRSNNLHTVLASVSPSTVISQPLRERTAKLVAPQASVTLAAGRDWLNTAWGASYHPQTHEIAILDGQHWPLADGSGETSGTHYVAAWA